MIWLTSDWHFGHKNIARYSGRPFDDSPGGLWWMNEFMVEAFNSRVAPEDEVWVLGDVAMGHLDDSLAFVSRLNGTKYLVSGNHDKCFPGHGPKADPWVSKYVDAGFASIFPGSPRFSPLTELLAGGVPVTLSHFPYAGDKNEDARYSEHRPRNAGGWLFHGHVHELWRQKGRMVNVGVDAWGGYPVSLDELSTLVKEGPRDLGPVPWENVPERLIPNE